MRSFINCYFRFGTLSWVLRNVSDEGTGFSHYWAFYLLARRSTSLNHSTSQGEKNKKTKNQENSHLFNGTHEES